MCLVKKIRQNASADVSATSANPELAPRHIAATDNPISRTNISTFIPLLPFPRLRDAGIFGGNGSGIKLIVLNFS
jgi:hypothetical protein